MPCATGSWTCPTPYTSITYDALNLPLITTDGGGGTITRTYSKNDVLVTVGPPSSGVDHVKSRQYEYDGLGRLTSVCEILASGGSPCGQSTAASGYKTSYAYSVPAAGGSQTVVTQGTQTRTYIYDGVGRLISESKPESGTTTYVYDSDPAVCKVTYKGDLIRKSDANGNNICHFYDSLHRLTDEGNYVNGAWVSGSCKRYRYDNSQGVAGTIPAGVAISNAMGHMVEAETDSCNPYPPTAPITDEWFSYSARGELTDVYELTPNSGGYYHTTVGYWANGALNTLSGVPGQTAWTFGVDGEGRSNTAVQGTTNLVTGVTYTPASQPQNIFLGAGDSDNYAYDANTGRMKNYTFTVGSPAKSITGGLTWNPNGTLQQLQISDGFNAGGTHDCRL